MCEGRAIWRAARAGAGAGAATSGTGILGERGVCQRGLAERSGRSRRRRRRRRRRRSRRRRHRRHGEHARVRAKAAGRAGGAEPLARWAAGLNFRAEVEVGPDHRDVVPLRDRGQGAAAGADLHRQQLLQRPPPVHHEGPDPHARLQGGADRADVLRRLVPERPRLSRLLHVAGHGEALRRLRSQARLDLVRRARPHPGGDHVPRTDAGARERPVVVAAADLRRDVLQRRRRGRIHRRSAAQGVAGHRLRARHGGVEIRGDPRAAHRPAALQIRHVLRPLPDLNDAQSDFALPRHLRHEGDLAGEESHADLVGHCQPVQEPGDPVAGAGEYHGLPLDDALPAAGLLPLRADLLQRRASPC